MCQLSAGPTLILCQPCAETCADLVKNPTPCGEGATSPTPRIVEHLWISIVFDGVGESGAPHNSRIVQNVWIYIVFEGVVGSGCFAHSKNHLKTMDFYN